jgi:ubiquitin carboxyl-terminal hydrolase 5/13
MASVLQSLFSLTPFENRYKPTATLHTMICPDPSPSNCLDCQMHKLADGLLSGRYSHPRKHPDPNSIFSNEIPTFQEGLKPTMFKALIGKGHPEFSTMRQQDSEEFLTHLIKVLRQDAKKKASVVGHEPTEIFKFGMEQRLECKDCGRVRYRIDSQDTVSIAVPAKEKGKAEDGKVEYESVGMETCLDVLMAPEALEYQCPACNKKVIATKWASFYDFLAGGGLIFGYRRSRFATFPQVLVVHAKKFQLVNWVPQKLGQLLSGSFNFIKTKSVDILQKISHYLSLRRIH